MERVFRPALHFFFPPLNRRVSGMFQLKTLYPKPKNIISKLDGAAFFVTDVLPLFLNYLEKTHTILNPFIELFRQHYKETLPQTAKRQTIGFLGSAGGEV